MDRRVSQPELQALDPEVDLSVGDPDRDPTPTGTVVNPPPIPQDAPPRGDDGDPQL